MITPTSYRFKIFLALGLVGFLSGARPLQTVSCLDPVTDSLDSASLERLVQENIEVKKVLNVVKRFAPRNLDTRGLSLSIVKAAKEAGYDPLFIAAVIKNESTFRVTAKSNRNAHGLMQITPIALKEVMARNADLRENPGELTDPEFNLRVGLRYLKQLENQYKSNRRLALMAYNCGPGRVARALRGESDIPTESVQYAARIMKSHREWS